jgi:cytochrome c biogenesis protein CcmG/thiol:disulfide interchange protein DsbE
MSLISARKSYYSIYFLFFLVFFGFFGCDKKTDNNREAPDFTLPDLSGGSISLMEFRGSPVLLDFWATWCPPCRRSIPELVELQRKYRDRGLVILGISLDDPSQINNQYLSAFKEQVKINYPILRATQKLVQDYFGDSPISIPTLFTINRKGRIVDVFVGFRPGAVEDSLKKIIE